MGALDPVRPEESAQGLGLDLISDDRQLHRAHALVLPPLRPFASTRASHRRSPSASTEIERRTVAVDSQAVATDSDKRLMRIFKARAEGDIATLVHALQDPEHARVAARALAMHADSVGDQRDAAVRRLRLLLRARNPHARAAAAMALGALDAHEAAEELLELAQGDLVDFVRSWAVAALATAGGQTPQLVAFLDDSSFRVRRAAVSALCTANDAAAIPALERAMQREQWYRRGFFRDAIRRLQSEATGGRVTTSWGTVRVLLTAAWVATGLFLYHFAGVPLWLVFIGYLVGVAVIRNYARAPTGDRRRVRTDAASNSRHIDADVAATGVGSRADAPQRSNGERAVQIGAHIFLGAVATVFALLLLVTMLAFLVALLAS
jgi:hypothetical protein